MIHIEGPTIILRPIIADELHRLQNIYVGTPLYFEALGINDIGLADVEAQFQAAQSIPGRVLLGVEVPAVDLLIGAIDLQTDYPAPGVATIRLLLIWGGFQRQGYGQECVALIVDWLNERGGTDELRVIAAENAEGLRFWQQHGFMPSGERATAPFRRAEARWLVQG